MESTPIRPRLPLPTPDTPRKIRVLEGRSRSRVLPVSMDRRPNVVRKIFSEERNSYDTENLKNELQEVIKIDVERARKRYGFDITKERSVSPKHQDEIEDNVAATPKSGKVHENNPGVRKADHNTHEINQAAVDEVKRDLVL